MCVCQIPTDGTHDFATLRRKGLCVIPSKVDYDHLLRTFAGALLRSPMTYVDTPQGYQQRTAQSLKRTSREASCKSQHGCSNSPAIGNACRCAVEITTLPPFPFGRGRRQLTLGRVVISTARVHLKGRVLCLWMLAASTSPVAESVF